MPRPEEGIWMEWKVVSLRSLYSDEWLDIRLADVELPGGRHLSHRMICTPPGAGVVAITDNRVLLIWRHRFITGSWGWEVPMGKVEDGESAAEAAAREFEEETGWRAGPLRHLMSVQPTPGLCDSVHHVYRTDEASYLGQAADSFESDQVAWVPLTEVRSLIRHGKMVSATTLAALLYVVG
jgi:8-oxo-dGTP pyrophosphatase MutT (NUDIX family)